MRVGTVFRSIRQKQRLRQRDLSDRCGVSQGRISRIERGHLDEQTLASIRAVASALDVRVDLVPRWRSGDLDRLMARGHSALHESVARSFKDRWPAWVVVPEASFAIYGERGVIDILAWQPGHRALLVIELKTDIVDVNELLGTLDRKGRLARQVALERGWAAETVSRWLIIAPGRTNRRRIHEHEAMIRNALPDDRRAAEGWLAGPAGTIEALSYWPDIRGTTTRPRDRPIRRVRGPSRPRPEHQ